MQKIYVKNMLEKFLKNKKRIFVCWIVIVVLFSGLGLLKAYPEKFSSSASENIEKYNEAIAEYDSLIADVQQTIDTSQKQVDSQQKYCDESILMQIDPTSVKTVSVKYKVVGENAVNTQAAVLNTLNTYISSSEFTEKLSEVQNDISSEYVAELVYSTVSGDSITVSVQHYDMEQAKAFSDSIRECIEAYESSLKEWYGDIGLQVMDTFETEKADISLQNTQNGNLTNLRVFTNSLADYKEKLVTEKAVKEKYIEQNKPSEITDSSPKKTLVEFGALGVIAGIILPFVVYALWYSMNGNVKCKEEIIAADLPVIADFSKKKDYDNCMSKLVTELSVMAKDAKTDVICMNSLGTSDRITKMKGDCIEGLKNQAVNVEAIDFDAKTSEQLQKIINAKNMILLIEAGNTMYAQIENELQFCKRFSVNVWGCIIIE